MFRKLIFTICLFFVPCLKLVASPVGSGENSLIKELPCSTGMPNTPTPTGSFETYEKLASNEIELDGKKISYYFLSNFNGHIGFHSKIFGEHPMEEEGGEGFKKGCHPAPVV